MDQKKLEKKLLIESADRTVVESIVNSERARNYNAA